VAVGIGVAVEQFAEQGAGAQMRFPLSGWGALRERGLLGEAAQEILFKRLTASFESSHRPVSTRLGKSERLQTLMPEW